MEEKKFGEYYEIIKERTKDVPKIPLAELHEQLKSVHTLEGYWARLDEEKRQN